MIWARYRRPLLFLVYFLFFFHTALWHYWGYEGVGHLGFGEFFGSMRTGIITAGTVFSIVVFLHALFFGGLFCGWFCHWGITQDIAAWIMKKAGIKPQMQHLDSKLIPWFWFIILIAQVAVFWLYNGLPTSFSFNPSATPVWTGVPRSILLICLTTIVSGFALTFLFGERAFCRSICTFRLWFSWFERIAPHKVRQIKECTSCQLECTNVCPMGVDVAAEIRDLGHVKNTECVKCHICIGACPNQVLETSLRKNSFHKEGEPQARQAALSSSVSLVQAAMAVIVVVLFGFDVGGNISLSLGFLSGFMLIHIWHTRSITAFEIILTALTVIGLYYKDDMNDPVSLVKGLAAIAVFLFAARQLGFTKGFEFINKHTPALQVSKPLVVITLLVAVILGGREAHTSMLIHQANAARRSNDNLTYASIMEACAGSHSDPAGAWYDLGKAQLKINQPQKAGNSFKKSLQLVFSAEVARTMFDLLEEFGNRTASEDFAAWLAREYPQIDEFTFLAGNTLMEKGDMAGAEKIFSGFITSKPGHQDGYLAMGELRLKQNRIDEAEEMFNRAYAISPASSAFFMADISHRRSQFDRAEKFYEEAIRSNPPNIVFLMDQGGNFVVQGKLREAINAWKAALTIDPDFEPAKRSIAEAEADLAAKKAAILGGQK